MKLLIVFLMAVSACFSQTLTTVSQIIKDAGGQRVSGSCVYQAAMMFENSIGEQIVGERVTVSFTNGNFYAKILPNDIANPGPQYYKVTCTGSRGWSRSGQWVVPTTGLTLAFKDIWVASPVILPSYRLPVSQLDYVASSNGDCIMKYNGVPQWRPCVQGSGGGSGGLDGLSTWAQIEAGTNGSGSITGTTTWAQIEQ